MDASQLQDYGSTVGVAPREVAKGHRELRRVGDDPAEVAPFRLLQVSHREVAVDDLEQLVERPPVQAVAPLWASVPTGRTRAERACMAQASFMARDLAPVGPPASLTQSGMVSACVAVKPWKVL